MRQFLTHCPFFEYRKLFVSSIAFATFSLSAQLHITELMYHPAGAPGESGIEGKEFIEIFNAGNEPLDLSGFQFDRGITFTFPNATTIPPDSYRILAKDKGSVETEYNLVDVLGPYEGNLSNRGETLRLVNSAGQSVLQFKYGSYGDWPAAPDGTGHSLIFPDLNGRPNRARDWTSSRLMGGSPGANDSPPSVGREIIKLVSKGTVGRYFKGTQEPSNGTTEWANPEFTLSDDWLSGPSGYGYSSSADELASISSVLSDMRGNYLSVYVRLPFELSAAQINALSILTLTMNYDDSFVVYLNGIRVAATGVNGNPPAFDQNSIAGNDYAPEVIDLTTRRDLLVSGRNILAIQGHNIGLGSSSDFILGPDLTVTIDPQPAPEELIRQIIVNEILASHESNLDFVEFYNPTESTLDLTGMWISDDADQLMKFQVPEGTTITPKGFAAFRFSLENGGFGLSSQGEAIHLTALDGQEVMASYGWGLQLPNVGIGRFPDGAPNWYYQTDSSFGSANHRDRIGNLVINELMYHAPEGQRHEYIEILNTDAVGLDLAEWEFIGVEFEFPEDFVIPGNAHAIIADHQMTLMTRYDIGSDLILGNFSGSLSNQGERVSLLNADDIVTDSVQYSDQFPWPVTPDGLGASLERSCIESQFDNANHWAASPLRAPSPLASNHVTGCHDADPVPVVISEFLYHSAIVTEDDRNLEFIEIYNAANAAVDLSNWVIAEDLFFIFPEQTVIAPEGHLTVAWHPSHVETFYSLPVESVLGPYTTGLPNGGGEIILVQADGRLVDRVHYDDDFPWPSLADGFGDAVSAGYSLERLCFSAPTTLVENWRLTEQPSPGRANPNPTCELPVQVVEVGLESEPIFAGQQPIVFAQISNCVSLPPPTSIELEYWQDDLELSGESVESIVMQLPSPDGELKTSECQWSAALPSFPENAIVRYRIRIVFNDGTELLSPAPDRDAFAWHSFFVDPGSTTNLPEQYHLFLSAQDWERLHVWTEPGRVPESQPNPNWNREVPAVFVADGVVHDVTVRHQGSRWGRKGGGTITFDCPSHKSDNTAQVRSWRIRFPSYRNHKGIDILILQKRSGWPQNISFKMFELAGVAAPRTTWAKLRINGCDYNNASFQIERPGRDLVERWFDEVGDLYKSQGYTGNEGPWSWGDERLIRGSLNGFSEQERYEHTYNRKTRNWENDPFDGTEDLPEGLIEGLHVARDSGPQAIRDYLMENFDVDLTLRYICTINYVGTFDDMFQNHFLNRRAADGKWCMLPWDMDNTLGSGDYSEWDANPFRGVDEVRFGDVGNRGEWWNRLKDSFFIAFEQEFLEVFHQLNNTVHSPENMRQVVTAAGAERGRSQDTIDSLLDHIQRRHDYLNDFIRPRLFPPEIALAREGNDLVIAWPPDRTDYALQMTSDLNEAWEDVNPSHFIQLSANEIQITPRLSKAFFRLVKQE